MNQLERKAVNFSTLPLTEAQREIWYGAQMSYAVSCSINQSALLKRRWPLGLERLTRALERLVERHEALRVTFEPNGNGQRVHPHMMVDVPMVDLSHFGSETGGEELQR